MPTLHVSRCVERKHKETVTSRAWTPSARSNWKVWDLTPRHITPKTRNKGRNESSMQKSWHGEWDRRKIWRDQYHFKGQRNASMLPINRTIQLDTEVSVSGLLKLIPYLNLRKWNCWNWFYLIVFDCCLSFRVISCLPSPSPWGLDNPVARDDNAITACQGAKSASSQRPNFEAINNIRTEQKRTIGTKLWEKYILKIQNHLLDVCIFLMFGDVRFIC